MWRTKNEAHVSRRRWTSSRTKSKTTTRTRPYKKNMQRQKRTAGSSPTPCCLLFISRVPGTSLSSLARGLHEAFRIEVCPSSQPHLILALYALYALSAHTLYNCIVHKTLNPGHSNTPLTPHSLVTVFFHFSSALCPAVPLLPCEIGSKET